MTRHFISQHGNWVVEKPVDCRGISSESALINQDHLSDVLRDTCQVILLYILDQLKLKRQP